MKIKLLILFVLVSMISQGQYSIKGTMIPTQEEDVILLYKIEGAKQKFINHTKLKSDTIVSDNKKQTIVGKFELTLPADAKTGSYRVAYRSDGGFIDLLFNKENIQVVFNPEYPELSSKFLSSKENKVYSEYKDALALTQKNLDSIHVSYLKNKNEDVKKAYTEAYKKHTETQNLYENQSKGMLANAFIKSSKTTNPETPLETVDAYLNAMVDNYFNNIDFTNPTIKNSPFLINKIDEFVFYLNTSDSQDLQQKLYFESVTKAMNQATDNQQKKQFSEYLISAFTDLRNSELVDWIIKDYYKKLPADVQDSKFIAERLDLLTATVGRTAPDFSWDEEDKKYKLSTLNDSERYLLVFWSTGCSHCLREIPELYEYSKSSLKDVSIIAFGIETDKLDWNEYIKKLYGWHNAIGRHPESKWENETVQKYNLTGTPSYFILDKNKKIIAMPEFFKDVKAYFNKK